MRQADLDLYIFETDATGTVVGDLVAASFSSVNVVEHLHFDVLASGYYGIGIDYFGNNFGSGDSILYGLAWSTTFVPEPGAAGVLIVTVALVWRRRR